MSTCIHCHSTDAFLFRGDDGRHRIRCPDCGYEGGPYVSSYNRTSTTSPRREQSQPSLETFAPRENDDVDEESR